MSDYSDTMLREANNYGGGGEDEDFFDEDFFGRDGNGDGDGDDDESNSESGDDDANFFGGARKKSKSSSSGSKKATDVSSKHSFSVAHVSIGSYEGGHFVSSTATNAAKKAATAIFRHIDLESGAVSPPKTAKGEVKSVKIDAKLKALYGKKPITGVKVNFVILRKERKSLPKYYAYYAIRTKLASPVKTAKVGNRPAIKYEYKVELKKSELPAQYKAENEEFKKAYNAAKKAKKAAVEKKEKKATAPKKTTTKKTTAKKDATPKKTASPKKASNVKLDDIIKALSNSSAKTKKAPATKKDAPKPKKSPTKKAAPKRSASPKPKKSPAKKAAPKRSASPKPKAKKGAKKVSGGGDFCSFF